MPDSATLNPATLTFGTLLRSLRKAGGMTQRDLAAALGYSDSHISGLEKDQRPPDLDAVMQRFIPALGLQDDPAKSVRLVEQAAAACGKRPPALIAFQRAAQIAIQTEYRPTPLSENIKPLPLPPTALIGRNTTVKQLCNRLVGHNGRLLTLVGPPGIGKTRLALAVATHMQHHYPQGAAIVPLAAISDSALMAVTILATVGSTEPSPKPPQIRLIECLRHKTMLLVLDNCEQLLSSPLSGVELIAELVAECPGLCILVTSRERLHLRAEQRFKVPALDLAAATELFVQRAQVVDANFACTAHNQPILEAICQRLDCLPLALELCAAQIELFSPTQLLAQLQDHTLDLLVDGARDLPSQHRNLRAAIGRSYTLLNDEERLLFRSLSVFVGGFDLAAVEAVVTGRPEIGDRRLNYRNSALSRVSSLRSLVGKSLVQAETTSTGEPRFLLLETIREFALEQMQVHGEAALWCERHYTTYLYLFRTGDSHIRGPNALPWFALLAVEQDNLRAAMQWTLNEARYTDAAWLVVAANGFWEQQGLQYDACFWLAQLLPHRHQLATDLHLAIWIILNACSAQMPEAFQPMSRYNDEVFALLEDCTDNLLQSVAWYMLAGGSADSSQQVERLEWALAFARAARLAPGLGPEFCLLTDRDFVLGVALLGYANYLLEQGDFAKATLLAKENYTLFHTRGDRYEQTQGLGMLGHLALLQGDLIQAHEFLQKALMIAVAVDYQEMICFWQPLFGRLVLYNGNAVEARRILLESLARCRKQKLMSAFAHACTYLAETALWTEELAEAEQWLAQSLAYHDELRGISVSELDRLWVAARLATAQQQYLCAATLFGLADQMDSQLHSAIAGPMRTLADAALATVRAALAPSLFANTFAAGQQLSLEKAFVTVLAHLSI